MSFDLHRIEFESTDGTGRSTNILLDGKQLWSVESIDVHIDGNSLVQVDLKMIGDQIGLDALADIDIDLIPLRRSNRHRSYLSRACDLVRKITRRASAK